jgi:hypothetical protein
VRARCVCWYLLVTALSKLLVPVLVLVRVLALALALVLVLVLALVRVHYLARARIILKTAVKENENGADTRKHVGF